MWRERPRIIEHWPEDCRFLMSIDENGTADLKYIQKQLASGRPVDEDSRYVTITGVVMDRGDFPDFRSDILELKRSYWPDGKCTYGDEQKTVCFHSREIRRREGPFGDPSLEYDAFVRDLSSLLSRTKVHIYSSTVDKVGLVNRYVSPAHPYSLAFNFVIERFCFFLQRERADGLILLESRGKTEDKFILRYALGLLENGNMFNDCKIFQRIKGVYFNPKWGETPNGLGSFVTLELADLYSHPIHAYVRYGRKSKAFQIVERKLMNYPSYRGYGLKVFP